MGDLKLLEKYILKSGIGINEFADRCSISRRRMESLIAGEDEIKASEMLSISKELNLTGKESEKVFFRQIVEYKEIQKGN